MNKFYGIHRDDKRTLGQYGLVHHKWLRENELVSESWISKDQDFFLHTVGLWLITNDMEFVRNGTFNEGEHITLSRYQ